MEGLGELDPDQSRTDHRDVVDLALHEADLEWLDVVPDVEGADSRMFRKIAEPARRSPGRDDQLVPLEIALALHALEVEGSSLDIDRGCLPGDQDLHRLAVGKVVGIAIDPVGRPPQCGELFDVPREHVG